jgi:transposase-like protein
MGVEVYARTGQSGSTIVETENDSWRVDETYIQIKGMWRYLYHAVDSAGNILECMLSTRQIVW